MLLSEQAYRKIDRELTKFPGDQQQSAIMAALAIAQDEKGWVSTDVIDDVAAYLHVPPIAVQEVATFYNMFNTHPTGRFKITVCTNLPCALRDGDQGGRLPQAESWASISMKPRPTACLRWSKASAWALAAIRPSCS